MAQRPESAPLAQFNPLLIRVNCYIQPPETGLSFGPLVGLESMPAQFAKLKSSVSFHMPLILFCCVKTFSLVSGQLHLFLSGKWKSSLCQHLPSSNENGPHKQVTNGASYFKAWVSDLNISLPTLKLLDHRIPFFDAWVSNCLKKEDTILQLARDDQVHRERISKKIARLTTGPVIHWVHNWS